MTNIECKDTFFLTTNKEINTFFLTNCGEDYKLKIKTETFWQIVKILILFVKLSRQETLYFCLVKLAMTVRIL